MEFMDDDGDHIKSKYLISHVNHFVLQTSNFLAKFVVDCEEKLVHFNRKIHQLESKVTLLETKNFTLQGKDEDCQTSNKGNEDDKTTKDKVNNNIQTPEQETVSQGKQSDLSENLNIESNSSSSPSNEEQTQDDNQPSPDEIQASQHPKLLKYFKMEKVGVPAPAIKGKMKVEGIDPCLLDDPNKFIRKDAFGVDNSIEVDGDDSSDDDD